MKELITLHQTNMLMIALAIIAPLVGLLWGAIIKQTVRGGVIGLLIGVGNLALWGVYNLITNKLGLDTVLNLGVNLVLFIVIGILIGLGTVRYGSQRLDK